MSADRVTLEFDLDHALSLVRRREVTGDHVRRVIAATLEAGRYYELAEVLLATVPEPEYPYYPGHYLNLSRCDGHLSEAFGNVWNAWYHISSSGVDEPTAGDVAHFVIDQWANAIPEGVHRAGMQGALVAVTLGDARYLDALRCPHTTRAGARCRTFNRQRCAAHDWQPSVHVLN